MEVVNLIETHLKSNHHNHFKTTVNDGLSKESKKIPSEFFYDDLGSKLFQKITKQPEYYLTRVEYSILKSHARKLANSLKSKKVDIIELGVGDGHKTKVILEELLNAQIEVNFYPIDISSEAMELMKDFAIKDSDLKITGVVAKYFEGIDYIQKHSRNQKLVLCLGSNIGNTDNKKGLHFLEALSQYLQADDLLFCGFDLVKELSILNAAYNDHAGVTREFNLNLLTRMNRELDADFNLHQFNHLGRFNPKTNAMESFLVSKIDQDVKIESLDKTFSFKEFEPIHLEYSHKYTLEDIDKLAKKTGFQVLDNFTDKDQFFLNSLWAKA